MKRLILPLLGAGLLALNACSSTDKSTTTDTASTGSSPTTAEGSAGAPATVDTAKTAMTTAPADSAKPGAMAMGPTAPHATDAEFMQSAAHSDQNEIQFSKMALAKGMTGMTKTLADKMIADHTKSSANLKPIAAKAGVTLPTDMDADHKAMAPQMEKLSGKAFETKYLTQMQADHQKTANTLKAHKMMTKNPALIGWIDTTLPVVEQHLNMANKDAGMKM